MKKTKLSLAALTLGVGMVMMTSCIGSFGLTKKVLAWNNTVTNQKFVNELVFVVAWVLPVYELSMLADVLLLNSMEFWTGSSPVASVDKVVKGDKGEYHVKSTPNGYDIEVLASGEKAQLLFDQAQKTWSVASGDKVLPLIQFVDDANVRVFYGEKSTVVNAENAAHLYADLAYYE